MRSLMQGRALQVFTLVVVVQAALFYSASRGEIVPLAAPLVAFPTHVEGWNMIQEGVIDQETQDVLKADDTLTRFYQSPEGAANLFIAYFKTQRSGQAPHSPKNCLPGSGWQPSESGHIVIPTSAGSISINRYIVSRGENQSLVLYWYQTQGRVIADEFAAKFYLVSDSIKRHRSDTSLVRVVVPIAQNRIDIADKAGADFVKDFYPAIKAYLPQ